jgi:hypothetical protein
MLVGPSFVHVFNPHGGHMATLVEAWGQLATGLPAIVILLESGTRAIEARLGEMADDYVQTVCPAYSIAVSVCGVVPGCLDKLINTRNNIIYGLCDTCGITSVIDAVVSAWNAIPKGMRTAIVDGVQAIDALLHGDLIGAFNHCVSFVADVATYAVDLVRDGFIYVGKGASWAAEQLWLLAANGAELAAATTTIGVRTFLQTLEDISKADPIALINHSAQGIIDTLTAVGCAFIDCDKGSPYDWQWDWQFVPFILPTTMFTQNHMDPMRSDYFNDPFRFNFGIKASNGMAGDFSTIRDVHSYGVGQEKGIIPYNPGAMHETISHVMPEHMPPISLRNKDRVINLIAKGQFARGLVDRVQLADIIKRQPTGGDVSGLAWLVGPSGAYVLHLLEQLGTEGTPFTELNRAIGSVFTHKITDARISFHDRQAHFLVNGQRIQTL